MAYALDHSVFISRYVEDGRVAFDNNISEREIKMVVIGRKSWMFADSIDGMRANAIMYSLVTTAKANGLNPYDYLWHVFATLPYLKTAAEVESLLPWNLLHLRDTH
ncbi:transposase domain-containing protein [Janthinobacterium sp. SUN128]|uniref:Transposase domain-containing protein n=1 Tax=Janthinobacterium lividum TaxID=29581 RepID=A0ABU0XT56_9BURK|nr:MULTISPECIES: transposase domain-containing protein [Janthinobacterium]MDO8035512.1 transposase domain-containing protein [Janthinobacterium sp. SUN128]MDQ4626707.1 transposase domain-containing protein [Janthinobacterium lividum]MDQ4674326.1 transposase domain-containing protein [Janthinobacterium lividum]MDQ4685057.1 transposase domain-containing protein [Janthinobacterium lividum]